MVYIQARAIKTTVEQTLQDHLWCEEKDVPLLTDHIKQGHTVLIVIDGEDELRDDGVIENLKIYAYKRQTRGGAKYLISSRTYHSSIDSKEFNRFLLLKGFTIKQGKEYIRRLFPIGQSNPDYNTVYEFTQKHTEKLVPVLTNPLRLHIFSSLARKGLLNFNEDTPFKSFSLFESLEKFVIRREGNTVTVNQSQDFYNLCLFAYLRGFQEIPEKLLKKYNIVRNYYAFLEKKTRTDIHAVTSTNYSFSHEVVFEYFVCKSIEQMPLEKSKPFLLSVFTKRKYHNIQKMIFEVILRKYPQNNKLFESLVNLILLQFPIMEQMVQGHLKDIDTFISVNELPSILMSKYTLEVTNLKWTTIDSTLDKNIDWLRDAGCFMTLEHLGIINHIEGCLQLLPPKQKEEITKRTLFHLLPCRIAVGNR